MQDEPKTTRRERRFSRVILIYEVERRPLGWISVMRLFPFADSSDDIRATMLVNGGLHHLYRQGLIDVDVSGRKPRYRRTTRGVRAARRALCDRRLSIATSLRC